MNWLFPQMEQGVQYFLPMIPPWALLVFLACAVVVTVVYTVDRVRLWRRRFYDTATEDK